MHKHSDLKLSRSLVTQFQLLFFCSPFVFLVFCIPGNQTTLGSIMRNEWLIVETQQLKDPALDNFINTQRFIKNSRGRAPQSSAISSQRRNEYQIAQENPIMRMPSGSIFQLAVLFGSLHRSEGNERASTGQSL